LTGNQFSNLCIVTRWPVFVRIAKEKVFHFLGQLPKSIYYTLVGPQFGFCGSRLAVRSIRHNAGFLFQWVKFILTFDGIGSMCCHFVNSRDVSLRVNLLRLTVINAFVVKSWRRIFPTVAVLSIVKALLSILSFRPRNFVHCLLHFPQKSASHCSRVAFIIVKNLRILIYLTWSTLREFHIIVPAFQGAGWSGGAFSQAV